MEEKEKVNPELYKKEFAIMNWLYERLSFNIYEQSLFCEVNFYKTMAWYIETQKEESVNWEEKVQATLDTIMGVKDEVDRAKYMEYYFGGQKIIWFRNHGWEEKADNLQRLLSKLSFKRNKDGKIDVVFPGMVKPAIPQWFCTWLNGHDLEHRVIADNRRSQVEALRRRYIVRKEERYFDMDDCDWRGYPKEKVREIEVEVSEKEWHDIMHDRL